MYCNYLLKIDTALILVSKRESLTVLWDFLSFILRKEKGGLPRQSETNVTDELWWEE